MNPQASCSELISVSDRNWQIEIQKDYLELISVSAQCVTCARQKIINSTIIIFCHRAENKLAQSIQFNRRIAALSSAYFTMRTADLLANRPHGHLGVDDDGHLEPKTDFNYDEIRFDDEPIAEARWESRPFSLPN